MEEEVSAVPSAVCAPPERITRRHGYNLQGLSFSPAELVAEIERQFGPQRVAYAPDARQHIAQSWPCALNDQRARADWGWHADYELTALVRSMWSNLLATRKTIPLLHSPLEQAA